MWFVAGKKTWCGLSDVLGWGGVWMQIFTTPPSPAATQCPLSLDLPQLWSAVWWLEAERCREDHQRLSPREMSSEGQFHMRGSAPGSEWRWAGSTQYPGFINHPAKAYRQTPSLCSPWQPLGLHRASEMSAQIWVLMQIIISIIFLHLCPRCQGNKAFPLSGSIRLQLVGILDSEPDGLAMLAAYVQQAGLCQARIRFLLIWSKQGCIHIFTWSYPAAPKVPYGNVNYTGVIF